MTVAARDRHDRAYRSDPTVKAGARVTPGRLVLALLPGAAANGGIHEVATDYQPRIGDQLVKVVQLGFGESSRQELSVDLPDVRSGE
jgi:hypothetical protein